MLSNQLKKIAQELTEEAFVDNIEMLSEEGDVFRKVLYTSKNLQLVTMSLKPGEDIGKEIHEDTDQFIRVEEGSGKAVLNGVEHNLTPGFALLVPMGIEHNVIADTAMKLYTLYSPPHHALGKIHQTKEEALADKEDLPPEM